MLNERTVAVVVPCYNEENQIRSVIESMPEFVDRIIVVNDKSRDETGNQVAELVNNANKEVILPLGDDVPRDSVGPLRAGSGVSRSSYDRAERVAARMVSHEKTKFIPFELVCRDIKKDRLILVNHLQNGGVGAAIASGYRLASELGIYCTAVMAGDGQMDPNELEKICMPVINDEVDYVKGNRLIHRSAWLVIPKLRYLGNSVLSILTKIASGYWRVSDTQTGYTAISIKALKAIRLHKIYRRYGMPNDMLVKLNIAFCTIREVESNRYILWAKKAK
jgi:glycosyltransferase involved in cell wall biosynthesis